MADILAKFNDNEKGSHQRIREFNLSKPTMVFKIAFKHFSDYPKILLGKC